eukprot:SAG22_NODE_19369_length_275_cov_1.181818_1_plen_72_part_10
MAEQPAGFRSASAAPGDFAPAKKTGVPPRFGTGGRSGTKEQEEWGRGTIPGMAPPPAPEEEPEGEPEPEAEP